MERKLRGDYISPVKKMSPELRQTVMPISNLPYPVSRINNLPSKEYLWVDEGFEKVFPFNLTKGITDFTRPLTGIIAQSKVSGYLAIRTL